MNRFKLAISATFVLVAGMFVSEAALGADRTDVWLVKGGGAGYRFEGERTWNEYAADGSLLAELEEQDRGPSHVLLFVKGRGIYLRLESGRSLTKPKNGGDFVKSREGDWSKTSPAAWPKPVPKEVVTDVWLVKGGRAGYRFEGDRAWREYASDGRLLAELEEQDRGPAHVLLFLKGRNTYLRLEAGKSLTKPKNGGAFEKSREGDWSRRAPRAWPDLAPREIVTDIWLFRGGRAGYRFEGDRTWREYASNGRLLAELEEQDRGPAHVLLYVKGPDIYLRLEAGRSLTKPKNGGAFVKNRDGNWSRRTPRAWPEPVVREVVTDLWLARGGRAGYRFEGDRTWREYASNGRLLAELEEQDRGPAHVLLYVKGRDIYLRLESGRSFTKPRVGGRFVKNQDGDWSKRTPTAWPKPVAKAVVTEQWLSGDGRAGFRRHPDGQWREYGADGRLLASYREMERSASHVLLLDPVAGSFVRLEADRCMVRRKNTSAFVPLWTGKWGPSAPTHWQPVQPEQPEQPPSIITDVWLVTGGLAGFRRERDGTWREYGADGKAVNLLREQERGVSHVLLHDARRDMHFRLEVDRCYTRFRGARDFVPQWNGGWAGKAPSHWAKTESPQKVVVTSVWLLAGGRAGFKHEGGRTWREYGPAGRPLNSYVEQERGADYVVLHHASRGEHLRLEPGKCLVKLRGQRTFSPQRYGAWVAAAPKHWLLPTKPPEIWLVTGGGGYRREGSPPVWVAYDILGEAGLRFVEESRTAEYVQLMNLARGLRIRLLAGELQVRDETGKFVRRATGTWSDRAPSNWPALPDNR